MVGSVVVIVDRGRLTIDDDKVERRAIKCMGCNVRKIQKIRGGREETFLSTSVEINTIMRKEGR